jgi:hypothetical protein
VSEPTFKRRLFVACHSRSGGRFLAKVLSNRLMRIGHEVVRQDGLVSWLHVGEGVVPWLDDPVERGEFERVVHMVRNPLEVITSAATTESSAALEYMAKNVPQLPPFDYEEPKSRFQFYMHAYCEWNWLIEERWLPGFRLRIEDIREQWRELIDYVGEPLSWDTRPPYVPPVRNHSRRHLYEQVVTWEMLEEVDENAAKCVREMGARYGY